MPSFPDTTDGKDQRPKINNQSPKIKVPHKGAAEKPEEPVTSLVRVVDVSGGRNVGGVLNYIFIYEKNGEITLESIANRLRSTKRKRMKREIDSNLVICTFANSISSKMKIQKSEGNLHTLRDEG